VSRAVTK